MAQGLTIAITGTDTLQLNSQVLSTLADENPGHLTLPNEMVTVAQGKNGTAIFAMNNNGLLADLTVRLTLAGVDDLLINGVLAEFIQNPSAFSLMTGVFNKRVGDGGGNIKTVSFLLSGGVPQKAPEMITSASGDKNQSVAVWPLRFANWVRIIS